MKTQVIRNILITLCLLCSVFRNSLQLYWHICYKSRNTCWKGLKAFNVRLYNTKRFNFKPSVLYQLFDAFVGSTLNYACEIWGFGESKCIERIHLKFCKAGKRL